MEKITITTYSFDELDPAVQKKLIEKNRYINTDFDQWCDFKIDAAKEDLAKIGYPDAEIRYSGFNSQGDGASFSCVVDLPQWCKINKQGRKYARALNAIKRGEWVEIGIRFNDHHYCHEYTMSIESEYQTDPELPQNMINELESAIIEDARAEAKKIYRALESLFEDLTTDDAVKETIRINDQWRYLANGQHAPQGDPLPEKTE